MAKNQGPRSKNNTTNFPAALTRSQITSVKVPYKRHQGRAAQPLDEITLPKPRVEHDAKLHDLHLAWLIRREGLRQGLLASAEHITLRSVLSKMLVAEMPSLSPARAKGIAERMLIDLHESEHTWLGTGPSSSFLTELVASTVEGLTT
jgi:hypothetical protein